MMKDWNRLPENIINVQSEEGFKRLLDSHLCNISGLHCSTSTASGNDTGGDVADMGSPPVLYNPMNLER